MSVIKVNKIILLILIAVSLLILLIIYISNNMIEQMNQNIHDVGMQAHPPSLHLTLINNLLT